MSALRFVPFLTSVDVPIDIYTLYATCSYVMKNRVDTTFANERLADLRRWSAEIEAEIANIKAQIAPLESELNNALQKLDLVQRLMHLDIHGEDRARNPFPDLGLAPADAGEQPKEKNGSVSPATLEDHIAQLLETSGEPIHVSEIRRRLVEAGVPLPGKGEEANIIVRMGRDEARFVRTGKGTYGLKAWGIAPAAPTRRVKKRKNRARSRSS